jgi:hypothetical protein
MDGDEQLFLSLARYIDARELLLTDRVERRIAEVAGKRAQLARKVERIAHDSGAKPHKDSRR